MLSDAIKSFSRFSRRPWVRWSARLFLTAYLVSYILLSLNGGYYGPYRYPVLTKPDGSWAMRQQFIWEPFHARLDRYGYNWSGAVFVLPILADRLVWHRDKIITIDDDAPQK